MNGFDFGLVNLVFQNRSKTLRFLSTYFLLLFFIFFVFTFQGQIRTGTPRRNANRRRRVPVSVHRRSPPTHQTNYNSPGKLATPTHRIDGVGSIPSIPTHWGLTPFFYDRIFADFLKPLLSKPGGWMPNAADPEVGAHPNRLNPCLHISHLRSKQIHS